MGTMAVPPSSEDSAPSAVAARMGPVGDLWASEEISGTTLSESIKTRTGLVGLEAPTGYGKTELLMRLRETWDGPVAARIADHGLNDVLGPLTPTTLLLIDDLANDEGDLVKLALQHGARGALSVVAARLLPREIIRTNGRKKVLTGADLSLSVAEIEATFLEVVDHDDARRIAHLLAVDAGGWSVAVRWLGEVATVARKPLEAVMNALESSPFLNRLHDKFEGLAPADLFWLGQLAYFPQITERCFEALAPGEALLDRALAGGVPILCRGDGHVEFNPLTQQWLQRRVARDAQSVRTVLPTIVANGDVLVAARLMLSINELGEAVRMIGGLPSAVLEAMNPADVVSFLERLCALDDTAPKIQLKLARAYHDLGRVEDAERAYETAVRVSTDSALATEIHAEQLAGRSLRGGGIGALADLMLSTVPPEWAAARAHLLVAKAVTLAHETPDVGSLDEAEQLLLRAVAIWESAGEPLRAAQTLRVLAATVLSKQWRFAEIDSVIRRCQELVRGHPRYRSNNFTMGCRGAAMGGSLERFDELEAEADAFLGASNLAWQHGYLAWSRMTVAGWRGQADQVASSFDACRRQLGQLLSEPTGATFLAESAEAFARAADRNGAFTQLSAARLRAEQAPGSIQMAELVVAARVGDPEEALQVGEALLADETTPPAQRWRVRLETAIALVRVGRIDDAAAARLRAVQEASLCGETTPMNLFADAIKDLSAAVAIDSPALHICVIGSFTVQRDGELVDVPPGHVANLIKILAVRGGRAPVEVILDNLWPEVDVQTGRRRLKNVLMRVKTVLGEHWLVRQSTSLAFGTGVSLDLAEFESVARRTLVLAASRDTAAWKVALTALERYVGDLLPDDLYDEWLEEPRTTLRARALALFDVFIRAPEDQSVAPSAFEILHRIDPYNYDQFVAIARRAEAESNAATFAAAVRRAQAIAADLGVNVSPELTALSSRVTGHPAAPAS